MIELTLLQLKVAVPIDHQQQLDMVALELRENFRINEMVRDSTEKERDLIGLGEGEWGCTYILGVNRHKKTPCKGLQRSFISATIVNGRSHCNGHRTPFNVYRSLKLLEESQVSRLGFFGLWAYSISSC